MIPGSQQFSRIQLVWGVLEVQKLQTVSEVWGVLRNPGSPGPKLSTTPLWQLGLWGFVDMSGKSGQEWDWIVCVVLWSIKWLQIQCPPFWKNKCSVHNFTNSVIFLDSPNHFAPCHQHFLNDQLLFQAWNLKSAAIWHTLKPY